MRESIYEHYAIMELNQLASIISHIEEIQEEIDNYTATDDEQDEEISKGLWWREDIS